MMIPKSRSMSDRKTWSSAHALDEGGERLGLRSIQKSRFVRIPVCIDPRSTLLRGRALASGRCKVGEFLDRPDITRHGGESCQCGSSRLPSAEKGRTDHDGRGLGKARADRVGLLFAQFSQWNRRRVAGRTASVSGTLTMPEA